MTNFTIASFNVKNLIGEMEYFSVLNDHLTDGSHPELPITNWRQITARSSRICARTIATNEANS